MKLSLNSLAAARSYFAMKFKAKEKNKQNNATKEKAIKNKQNQKYKQREIKITIIKGPKTRATNKENNIKATNYISPLLRFALITIKSLIFTTKSVYLIKNRCLQ